MIAAVACLAATSPWKRFGYFIFIFGSWDIFFYIWLKLSINWPASLLDWDILFLIPLPWIGPVIAPLMVALMMTTCGLIIILRMNRGQSLRLTMASVVLFLLGTAAILFSFISDTGATLRGLEPLPYRYELLAIGLVLYGGAFMTIKTIAALPREPG